MEKLQEAMEAILIKIPTMTANEVEYLGRLVLGFSIMAKEAAAARITLFVKEAIAEQKRAQLN